MSIATLKRKTHAKYNNSSVNTGEGFSLNGTHRNQGYVGQTSLSRSLSRTLMKGNVVRGHGGCCGTYNITPIVQSGITTTENSRVIKSSVLSTKGMLRKRLLCNPCNVVKPTQNPMTNIVEYRKKEITKCTSTPITITYYVRLVDPDPFVDPYYIFSTTPNGIALNSDTEALTLQKGISYIFIRTDSGHAFNIGTDHKVNTSGIVFTSTSTNSAANLIVDGVVSIQNGEQLSFTIPENFSATLKYYCVLHGLMIKSFNLIDAADKHICINKCGKISYYTKPVNEYLHISSSEHILNIKNKCITNDIKYVPVSVRREPIP